MKQRNMFRGFKEQFGKETVMIINGIVEKCESLCS